MNEFHYTKPEMVRGLVKLVPFQEGDSVLDAGSGRNKVWFNSLPNFVVKYECELEDNCDFLKWNKPVDWVIGNPPYDIGNKFIAKASEIALKGTAFLLSIKALNSITPLRLEKLKANGFYLNRMHIVSDKRWFGRYYFVVFTKAYSGFVTWETKTY